jgi:hypothetical protein
MARNHHILHMPVEWMWSAVTVWLHCCRFCYSPDITTNWRCNFIS